MERLPPDRRPAPADLVELGTLRGAYGVKGWVRVQPHSAEAGVLRSSRNWWVLGEPAEPFEVAAVRRHGSGLVAKLNGCDTPEQADRLRGRRIAVSREEFPPAGEGEVYWVDLIGARVVNRSGDELGVIAEVSNNGAQDLLRVRGAEADLLVPLVPRYVDEVDLAQRVVRVDWQADW